MTSRYKAALDDQAGVYPLDEPPVTMLLAKIVQSCRRFEPDLQSLVAAMRLSSSMFWIRYAGPTSARFLDINGSGKTSNESNLATVDPSDKTQEGEQDG